MQEQINPPDPEIAQIINNILIERDIFIPSEHLELVVASYSHWLEKSVRGAEYMAHILNLDSFGGCHENKYLEKDGFGRLTNEIKADSIVFLRGCIINGESHPLSQVEIQQRDKEACDSCGCKTICIKEVETSYGKQKLCSKCATSSDLPATRDAVDLQCSDCTYSSCSWHPVNVDAPPFE